MNNKILLTFLTIFLIFSPVSAQSLLRNWYEWLNIPEDWTKPPNLIYYVLIPFFGTFAIIFGILTATRARIFENKRVNILLSFIFAIALFYTGIMPAIVLYLFTFGGAFGVIAFFALFFVLTTLYGSKKTIKLYGEAQQVYNEYKKFESEAMDAAKKNKKTRDKVANEFEKKLKSVRRKINKFKKDKKKKEEKIRDIRDDLKSLSQKHILARDDRDKRTILENEIKPKNRELRRKENELDKIEAKINVLEKIEEELLKNMNKI